MSEQKSKQPAPTEAPDHLVDTEEDVQEYLERTATAGSREQAFARWAAKNLRRLSLRAGTDVTDPIQDGVVKLDAHISRHELEWVQHPFRQVLVNALEASRPPGGWKIDSAFLIGLSPAPIARPNVHNKSGFSIATRPREQLVLFWDTVKLLSNANGIPKKYVQELREWSPLEKAFLETRDTEIVYLPTAEQNIDPGSFVYLPCVSIGSTADILGRCPSFQPGVVIASGEFVTEHPDWEDLTVIDNLLLHFMEILEQDANLRSGETLCDNEHDARFYDKERLDENVKVTLEQRIHLRRA